MLRALAFLCVGILVACAAPQRVDLVVRGVTVYTGEDEPPFVATVTVKDGKFAGVYKEPKGFGADEIVDGTGLYMTPGLWDMHAHIANGVESNIDISEFPKHGVTSIRDLGGFLDKIYAAQEAIMSGALMGPSIYPAGPTLNGEVFAPFQRAVTTEEEVRAAVNELADAGVAVIKIHRAFKPELLPVVIGAAHERGLKVTGHIPLGVSPLQACEAGMDGIEHLGSFLEAWSSAAPPENASMQGAFGYMQSDESAPLYACLASRRVVVDPTLVVYPAVARERVGDGPWPPEYVAFMKGVEDITLRLYQAGVPLVAGTDSAAPQEGGIGIPPGASMLDELELLQTSGIPARDVIAIATLNGAKALSVEAKTGSIAIGKDADFLLLEGDPGLDVANFRKLKWVYRGGVAAKPN